jgi:hypothetical protein
VTPGMRFTFGLCVGLVGGLVLWSTDAEAVECSQAFPRANDIYAAAPEWLPDCTHRVVSDTDQLRDQYSKCGNYTELLGLRLLKACLDVNAADIENIIALGADINFKGPDGKTPIMVACLRYRQENIDVLLSHGANRKDLIPKPEYGSDLYRANSDLANGLNGLIDSRLEEESLKACKEALKLEQYADRLTAEKEQALQEAQRVVDAKKLAANEDAWKLFMLTASRHDVITAKRTLGMVGFKFSSEKQLHDAVSLTSNLMGKKGQLVYIDASFESNAPGGIIATFGPHDQWRMLITGVRPGSMVSGEDFTFVGRVQGTFTYRTISGGSNTVPKLRMETKL